MTSQPTSTPPSETPSTHRRVSWQWMVGIFLLSLAVFAAFSGDRLKGPSPDNHFVYLAHTYNQMIAATFSDEAAAAREGLVAFELDREPHHRNDWASYREIELRSGEVVKGNWAGRAQHGEFKLLSGEVMEIPRAEMRGAEQTRRYFVSFPPGPGFLMMPLVAVWGWETNDVLFTIVFAALNVLLMFLLLERLSATGVTERSRSDNLWLTALFGFGTVHLWCAVLGQVWFTALVVGITFTLGYIYFGLYARRPFLAGVCLALGFATRTPLVFSAIFFFLMVAFPGGRLVVPAQYKEQFKKLVLFCIPCLAVGLSLLFMNYVRFESFTEFGHRYLAEGRIGRIVEYGLFHWHFLGKNLSAAFTLMPELQTSYPYVVVSRHGMSLLLTTPAFAYLLWPRERRDAGERFLHRALWATVAAIAIPGFLYQNTGYEQFGYRFSLDFTAYLIVLLAVGRRPLTRLFKACVVAGFAVNAFGAITFKRMAEFYSNRFFV